MAKILVVEDSSTARLFIKSILQDENHEVLEAENGNICLSMLQEHAENLPDLVIMDIVMPEKEGIETIMLLKDRYPDLPVLAISGVSLSDTYLKSAKRFGAELTLLKPFNKEEGTLRPRLGQARGRGGPSMGSRCRSLGLCPDSDGARAV